MPATAAIDNETLDHLLSMTDLALAALGRPALAMFHDWRRQRLPDAASRHPSGARFCAQPASHRRSQYSIRDRIRTWGRPGPRIGSSALCGGKSLKSLRLTLGAKRPRCFVMDALIRPALAAGVPPRPAG